MTPSPDFDRDLIAVVGRACSRARELSSQPEGLPQEEVKRLRRSDKHLTVATEQEIDWKALETDLAETQELWEELTEVRARAIERGELIPSGQPDPYPEFGAHGLWGNVVRPLLKRYHAQRPDWEWDEALARRLFDEWSDSRASRGIGWCQTIAPLHNFEGPEEAIEIEDDIVIRPLTDADREALWLNFGTEKVPSPLSPSIADLERWSHAIEYRWRRPAHIPVLYDDGTGVGTIREVVNAVRLHHPGVTGTTLVWTRPDPPPDLDGTFQQALLSAPDVLGSYQHPLATRLGPDDAAPLGSLLRGMRATRDDRRLALALRRFDSAYSRYEQEDSLIDLWIAFEALLLPERSELSYRVALRIAQLVALDGEERRRVFREARSSYNRRSKVVHGEVVEELDDAVEQTRELARRALRTWILEPPPGGVGEIDESLLD